MPLSKLKNIERNLNLARTELDEIVKKYGVAYASLMNLDRLTQNIHQLIVTFSNPNVVNDLESKLKLKEVKKEMLAQGKTIKVKKMEIKEASNKIKALKSQYKKEKYPEAGETQSKIKLLSNSCAKLHLHLQELKNKHIEQKTKKMS